MPLEDDHRSQRSDQGAAGEGQAGGQLRRSARRRHDRVRLLDLFRLLHRSGQQHGAARQQRSGRGRPLSRNGRGPGRSTAASSTTAPRPTSPASRGTRAASSSNGTAASGPATTCRTSRRPPSPTSVGPFIMNPEGTAGSVRARPDARRAVPGALRAVRSRRSTTCWRRRCAATRLRACSRTTWSSSATPRSFPTRRPPIG